MAYANISPSLATASISISLAFSINSDTTTGYCFDTWAASFRKCDNSFLFETTFIAAHDKTYDGMISTGNPIRSTNSKISDVVVNSFQLGWSTFRTSSIAENLCLFSALSIETGDVPSTGTFSL